MTLEPSGTAGDVPGTWRGPVTVTASIKDAVSGVAAKRFSVDGGKAASLGTDPIVIKGDGAHTITVTASDKAGNKGSTTLDAIIDTNAPVIELRGRRRERPDGDAQRRSRTASGSRSRSPCRNLGPSRPSS